MSEGTCTNRAVVLSDTHFGVIHDPSEAEETNITDLMNLLDLIINDIKPKTIILLGDILDLWRVNFEYAWDNASDIKFFERLTAYIKEHKDNGAELIYVLGNHDHFLQEICWAIKTKERYKSIISNKGEDEIRYKEQRGGENGNKSGRNDNILIKELEELSDLTETKGLDGVKFYYPHYLKDFKGDLGIVYFDHGHYNTKEQRKTKKILAIVVKYLSKYFTKSKIFKGILSENVSPREVYEDLEANLASVYSLLYYTKLDNIVRSGRDFIWRSWNLRWILFSSFISIIITSIFAVCLSKFLDYNNWKLILPFAGGSFILLTGFITRFAPKILGIFLPRYLTNIFSEMRGKSVKEVLPQIVDKDISIEKQDYKYINLMREEGAGKREIRNYIFGHTHKAGKIKDKNTNLTIYNCGSWVQNRDGKNEELCTNSFIIIDPDSDQIKIYHMENMDKKECEFDENGKCKNNCK